MKRALVLVAACGGSHAAAPDVAVDVAGDGATDAAPCTTRVTYGKAWIRPAGHAAQDDVGDGDVTWDGTCTDDGANSFALLSNGWKPYFTGSNACELALDHAATCASAGRCTTRITYGPAWIHAANHPAQYDDVDGRVFAAGSCTLSNGWQPAFTGGGCALSLEWNDCGGLYWNPVMASGCADPGVVRDGSRYLMSCTSGNAANAFPIYVSTNLVTWTAMGHILPAAGKPAWAVSDFWAPEIHPIGAGWVAYFSARGSDGKLAIGAATASDPLGPYTALPQPLVHDANMGLIDASEFTASDGTPYLLWKEDGNAVGQPTPIHARALAADGVSFAGGTTATLVTNDQTWEGAVTEGPWMIERQGTFYLFYSGNSYANSTYALGVARASSPLGPFTKAAAPIVTTGGAWVGPGHCSVVPGGDDLYVVYHAWQVGHVNGAGDERYPLVDQLTWANGWPAVPGAPSSATRPLP
jgi:GH43 family beta-xylosidase